MTKIIPLTKGFVAIVDDEDFARVNQYKWQIHTKGYAYRTVDKSTILMHRYIMENPVGFEIDHINRNKLDNRRSNLRTCSRTQNAYNKTKRAGSASLYKGVVLDVKSSRWRARITIDGKRKSLGMYKTEKEAALAYNIAARESGCAYMMLNGV